MQHREILVRKSARRLGFYGSAVSETQIRFEFAHWEPESGTYDKQKVKLTYLILFFRLKVVESRPCSHPV